MPKQTSRSFRGLLRAFGIRGEEELAFPLDTGVKAVIDADRYDPNPVYILGLKQAAVVGEGTEIQIRAGAAPLFFHQMSMTSTANFTIARTDNEALTVAPGPGAAFTVGEPHGSHTTPPLFGAVILTGSPFPGGTNQIENPWTLSPFALRPFTRLVLRSGANSVAFEFGAIVEELGFE